MKLKGKVSIFCSNGKRSIQILKSNAITYDARNVLTSMLVDGSTPLQYMAIINTDISNSGLRYYKPELTDMIPFYTDDKAVIDMSNLTQTVGIKTISIPARTITFSGIDSDSEEDHAVMEIEVNIPAGTLKTGEEFNCIAIYDSTADPAANPVTARIFSFIVLPAPVVIGADDNYVIKYIYTIR